MKTIRTLHLSVPADLQRLADLDDPVIAFLRAGDIAVTETSVYDVRLALQELCVNIVNHAYDQTEGTIELDFALQTAPPTLVIITVDRGRTVFNSSTWTPPNLDEPQVHGYGLFLIGELMDTVEYQRRGNENHWRLTKTMSPA